MHMANEQLDCELVKMKQPTAPTTVAPAYSAQAEATEIFELHEAGRSEEAVQTAPVTTPTTQELDAEAKEKHRSRPKWAKLRFWHRESLNRRARAKRQAKVLEEHRRKQAASRDATDEAGLFSDPLSSDNSNDAPPVKQLKPVQEKEQMKPEVQPANQDASKSGVQVPDRDGERAANTARTIDEAIAKVNELAKAYF